MLTINLRNIFNLRMIEKPQAWMLKAGIQQNSARRLLNNEQQHIRFDDLEALCLGLNCSPTDLFIWQPDSKAEDIPGHPLQAIRSDKLLPDVLSQLKNSSLDELKLVNDFLEKLREEKKAATN